ncbi:MAG: PPC domain-containing protein, partial [Planctomycetota bacterium]
MQPARRSRKTGGRKLHSQALEPRQLLAGPDIIGIRPNEGPIIQESIDPTQVTELSVSPRELVFRFDDNASLDPATLNAIQLTRTGGDGVFESASAISDLGTSGAMLMEFRAVATGSIGNGIVLNFTGESRNGSSVPTIDVEGTTVNISLNTNPTRPTLAGDLISALANDAEASLLVEAILVSGSSQQNIAATLPNDLSLELIGANAAEAVTDFGTGGLSRVRLVASQPGEQGRGTSLTLERRAFGGQANPVVLVTEDDITVQLNSTVGFQSTVADLINAINNNVEASQLLIAVAQEGDVNTVIGGGTDTFGPITLSGVNDVAIQPGFVGLGDNDREVVFRFAEPLPDDLYQIDILGSGSTALRSTDGELFRDGENSVRQFLVNLGPQVAAVVPEPVRRQSDGSLQPEVGFIEVHFNSDNLDLASAQNPDFYQLIFTRDSASNLDDPDPITPVSVLYSSVTNIARLNFGRPLSRIPDPDNPAEFLTGAARLRIGTSDDLPAPPTEVSLNVNGNFVEPGDTFNTAFNLNNSFTISPEQISSARISSEIFNTSPFGLDLPGPDLPGTREIRPDDPARLLRAVPLDYLRNGADVVDGISIIQYNFAPSWLGDDPTSAGIDTDQTYFNIISEQQRERVREVMQLYSEYLGVSFVEVEGEPTSDAFFSIAVGDLYGGDPRVESGDGGVAVVTRDRDGDGIPDLGVMDFQDFDESVDDQFGGEFFRGAMFVVGQLLGYGYADDLPQPVSQSTDFIFQPGTDTEPAFPALADIVHGQHLFRPDSTDIDLYRFELPTRGKLSIETIAERLNNTSLLDTTLQLYRQDENGTFELFSQNDDYFSNDSLIDLDVPAGTYIIGVSARGNDSYDPNIESSGFGGLTEGEYDLVINFDPATAGASIQDTTGLALDGDGDGRPGGVFNFWFEPSDSNTTLYVDKAASGFSGANAGTISNPFREIDQAIAAASPGDTVRVIGNGGVDGLVETRVDNFAYEIGFANNGTALEDGSSLEVPQGVRLLIESGAIL